MVTGGRLHVVVVVSSDPSQSCCSLAILADQLLNVDVKIITVESAVDS